MGGRCTVDGYKPLLRYSVPGFCRAMQLLDKANHRLGHKLGIICDLYDWSLGLTWREARS